MVKTALVEQDLEAGKQFLDALMQPTTITIGRKRLTFGGPSHFRVKAAFWWYLPESAEWRLVIATPLVDEKGPLATYKDIQKVLTWHPELNLPLQSISVLSPKDKLVKLFQKAMKMAPEPVGVRFTRSALEGTYIEDAYVYRLS